MSGALSNCQNNLTVCQYFSVIFQDDKSFTKGVCSPVPSAAAANGWALHSTVTVDVSATQAQVDTEIQMLSDVGDIDVFIGCVYTPSCIKIVKAARKANFNPNGMLLTTCVGSAAFENAVGVKDSKFILSATRECRGVVHVLTVCDTVCLQHGSKRNQG